MSVPDRPIAGTAPAVMDCHPLEVIPFFRRIRRSIVRDFVYTVIWNSLFAAFFALPILAVDPGARILDVALETFVFAQCIGFVVYGGFLIGNRIGGPRIHRGRPWVRITYYCAIPVLGIFPGCLIAFRILNWGDRAQWLFSLRSVVSVTGVSLLVSALLLLIFLPRERAARAEAAMAREQARVAAAEREATTARLKMLEAQVEPHFL